MPTGTKEIYYTGMLYFHIEKNAEMQFKAAAKAQGKTASALGRELVTNYLELFEANQIMQKSELASVS